MTRVILRYSSTGNVAAASLCMCYISLTLLLLAIIRGLVVPCIRGVQNLSIFDIAKELCRLRERATDGKLSQDDLGIGNAKESRTTFSISNIGSLGGTYCSPIITPPQVVEEQNMAYFSSPPFSPSFAHFPHYDSFKVCICVCNMCFSHSHVQVGIAALGRIRRVPQYLNDDSNEVVAVKILNVSYSGASFMGLQKKEKTFCLNISLTMASRDFLFFFHS